MKTRSEIIKLITVLLAVLICGVAAASCASGRSGGRVIHTIFAGTGTTAPAPESVPDATLPPETSVNTGEDSSVSVDTGSDITGSDDSSTSAPETSSVPADVTYDCEIVTVTEDLGSSGGVKSTRTLKYPKISGLSDTTIQDKVNTLIANIAEAKFSVYVTNVAELLTDGIGVEYQIKETNVTYLGNNILSLRSAGTVQKSGKSQEKENFIYCNFINLSTGKELKPKTVYSDFGAILDLLGSGGFTRISGSGDDGLENFIKLSKSNIAYGVFPETYFTADSLVIVIDETLSEYSVPLEKVNVYLTVSPSKN